MRKQAILKRAKHDPAFRHRMIGRLIRRQASNNLNLNGLENIEQLPVTQNWTIKLLLNVCHNSSIDVERKPNGKVTVRVKNTQCLLTDDQLGYLREGVEVLQIKGNELTAVLKNR